MSIDGERVGEALDACGYALVPGLLEPGQCQAYAASYADPALFRSRVVMERHGFGRGEYQGTSKNLLRGEIFALRCSPYLRTAALLERNCYRVNMRHGVSRLRGGTRHTLGILFHDAA